MVRPQHGSILGTGGWTTVVAALSALFDARLVPEAMLELDDFTGAKRRLAWNATSKPAARKDGGSFFSAFSAYLYAELDQPEELNTSIPAYGAAVQCVLQYRLPELLSESRYAPRRLRSASRAWPEVLTCCVCCVCVVLSSLVVLRASFLPQSSLQAFLEALAAEGQRCAANADAKVRHARASRRRPLAGRAT